MPASAVENPDIQAVLKMARQAPPLPAPTGKTVRVAGSEELAKAAASAESGTTILLADGTYSVDRLPVEKDRVTLRSASGQRDRVILDGGGKFTRMICVRRAKDFTIADLTLQNCKQYGIFMLADSDVQRPTIYNVRFNNIWVRAVKGTHPFRIDDSARDLRNLAEAIKLRPTGGQIRHCLFVNDKVKPYDDDGFNGDYVSGMDMMWLKDWTIADNVFVGIRGKSGGGRGAVFLWVNSENVVVERNLIINCDRGICFGNPSGDPLHMTNGIARNNFIVGGTRQAVEFCRTRNCRLYNNTVYSQDPDYKYRVHVYEGCEGAEYVNNLIRGRSTVSDGVKGGNNLIGDCPGWFADPAIGDLHLTAAAKDAFAAGRPLPQVTDDFDGRQRGDPPDVGAAEHAVPERK